MRSERRRERWERTQERGVGSSLCAQVLNPSGDPQLGAELSAAGPETRPGALTLNSPFACSLLRVCYKAIRKASTQTKVSGPFTKQEMQMVKTRKYIVQFTRIFSKELTEL